MLLDSYQSQLPDEGFPVIRDLRFTGTYLARRGPVKGLFAPSTHRENKLLRAHLSIFDAVAREKSIGNNFAHVCFNWTKFGQYL